MHSDGQLGVRSRRWIRAHASARCGPDPATVPCPQSARRRKDLRARLHGASALVRSLDLSWGGPQRVMTVPARKPGADVLGCALPATCSKPRSAVGLPPRGKRMIRLKHLSGSLQGRTTALDKAVLRIGRAPDCDVRFDQVRDPKVSNHHAELLLEEGSWFVVDTASTNGTLINGRRVSKHRVRSGDKLQIGAGGPVVQVLFEAILREQPTLKTEAMRIEDVPGARRFDNTEEISALSLSLKESADTQTARLAELAAKRVAMERAKAGGQSSGKTMFIMADTMREVQQGTRSRTKKRWVRVVAVVAGAAAAIVAVLSVVIVQQRREISRLVQTKNKLDKEIEQVQQAMDSETDP